MRRVSFPQESYLWVLALCLGLVLVSVPIPRILFDLALVANLGFAGFLLWKTATAPRLLALPGFPTLLLCAMVARLGLFVAALRQLLTSGEMGLVANLVSSWTFATNPALGVAILVFLGAVHYVMVARGSERVAEVAARFALDALPGAQAAIEADLRHGAITLTQAQDQRKALIAETQLYGAMDGALRFVKGDAVGGVLFLGIALLASLYLGFGLSPSLLGVALVTQLPALMLALSASLLLTKGHGISLPMAAKGFEPLVTKTTDLSLPGVAQMLAALEHEAGGSVLVRETIPRKIDLPLFSEIVRRLVSQKLLPLDLREVLEAVAALPNVQGDAFSIAEELRPRLTGPFLATRIKKDPQDGRATLDAILVSVEVEEELREAGDKLPSQELEFEILEAIKKAQEADPTSVLLCQKDVRRRLGYLLQSLENPKEVLSYEELPPSLEVTVKGHLGPSGFLPKN